MGIKRIIPCLDIQNGRVVKGVNFVNIKDAGDPGEIATYYGKAGADELVLLDITATADNRKAMTEVIRRIAGRISVPLTAGGGVKSAEDFERIIEAGADKVSIGSGAIKRPELIAELADRFGRECVVVAIDAKLRPDGRGWDVFTRGGRVNMGMDVLEWAMKAESLGAGEILLTSMDRDGTKDGYDIRLTKLVAKNTGIPVIASGGAGTPEHFYDVLKEGEADAALAASLFHFRQLEIRELKAYLKNKGVEVRI